MPREDNMQCVQATVERKDEGDRIFLDAVVCATLTGVTVSGLSVSRNRGPGQFDPTMLRHRRGFSWNSFM